MAAPTFADGANVEELIAYISTELIPQRVADLTAARPRRILSRSSAFTVSGTVNPLPGFASRPGDQGNGSGLTYNAGVITASVAGTYRIDVSADATAIGGQNRNASLYLRINGGGTPAAAAHQGLRETPGSLDATLGGLGMTALVELQAGDEVTLSAYASGSTTVHVYTWSIEKVA